MNKLIQQIQLEEDLFPMNYTDYTEKTMVYYFIMKAIKNHTTATMP